MTSPTSGPVDLDGQTAVVTGAGGGMGTEICRVLAREGADIVATDVDSDQLDGVESTIRGEGRSCQTIECDVTSPSAVERLADLAYQENGTIEILVCTHGFARLGDAPGAESHERFESGIAVNLTGTFQVIEAFFSRMTAADYGKIVCIGSLAGTTGRARTPPSYAASKGGIHALTRTYASDGGSHGVLVNAIAPGPVRTPFNEGVSFPTDEWPLARMGRPEDVAETVLFLASQQSHWLTGQVLHVNGGIHM